MFKQYLILFFLAHILADFYIQTEKIAKKKEKSIVWVLFHCICYWGVMAAIVLPVLSIKSFPVVTAASGLHCIIDIVKYIYVSYKIKNDRYTETLDRNVFFTDQILHSLCIAGISYWLAANHIMFNTDRIVINIFKTADISAKRFIYWLFALLLINKPANIALTKLLGKYRPEDEDKDLKSDKQAGKFIGTLERIIMLIFLSIGQYSAIGLVLTAKSIARHDRISKDKNFAEYYLIGTLASTLIALVVSFVLN